MGYKFSLVLSREVNDEESAILQGAIPADAIFGSDSLPTDAEITVTKMEFDDTVSPTLAEAIESALDAVKKVPDLGVPGLTVPAQPAGPEAEATAEDPTVLVGKVVEDDPPAKKASARKPAAKKASTRKPSAKKASDDKAAPVEAGAGTH